MSHTTFDALPDQARIWVFAAQRPIADGERTRIAEVLDNVFRVWKSKEELVKGCYRFQKDRFLIVGGDESEALLSGCSVDAMMKWLMQLEQQVGLKLIDRMSVHYRRADGSIETLSRAAFRKLVEAGDVTATTPVFDTVISRIESLREGRFEIPLAESWHAKLFLPAQASN